MRQHSSAKYQTSGVSSHDIITAAILQVMSPVTPLSSSEIEKRSGKKWLLKTSRSYLIDDYIKRQAGGYVINSAGAYWLNTIWPGLKKAKPLSEYQYERSDIVYKVRA